MLQLSTHLHIFFKFFFFVFFLSVLLFFSACSGGGGSDSKEISKDKIAYFIDSPVSGLHYISQSKNSVTTENGSFTYTPSDTNVTFKVGSITLGTINIVDINPDGKVYVQDLVGVSRDTIENDKLLKIASFLQSLDNNSNSSIINLTQSDLDKLIEVKNIKDINLTRQLNFAQKPLKNILDVKEHLGDTMRMNGISLYNYTPQVEDSNITTYKNTLSSGIFNTSDKNDKYLDFILESNTSHGVVAFFDNSNTFRYTPDSEYVGTDSFTYKAYDGEKYSQLATVNITVKDAVGDNNDITAPTAPMIVSINSQNNKLTLFWLGSTDDTTATQNIRYEIHISEDMNFTAGSTTIRQTVVNSQEADIDALMPDTLYYFKIKALDEAGNASTSEESSIKIVPEDIILSSTASIKKATDLHLENVKEVGDTLIFEDSKKSDVPEIGDIFIGNRDDAYLKRVVSVSKTEDITEIQTVPVAITEVVDTAKLSSKVVLFDTADVDSANNSMRRSVVYKTNNMKESTTSWGSGRFSVTESKNLLSNSRIKKSATKYNTEFSVSIVKNNIQVIQNQNIQIDIEATMKDAGIEDEWKFKNIELVSFTHNGDTDYNKYGAWLGLSELSEESAKGYLKWKPTKRHVSAEPYIATFKVYAEDAECSDIFDACDNDTVTIQARITVIGDGKVDTGGETSTTLSSGTEFSNDVTLDFTPTLTIEHDIEGRTLKYAKVSLNGELDFSVLSKFQYSSSADFEKKIQLITPKTYISVYVVGTVPIYQEITYTIDAEFSALAEGSLEATSDLQTSFEITAGMEYDGAEWKKIIDDDITKDYTATIEAAGGVHVKVRLIPNIEVKFYKVASSGLSLEPWLDGDISATATAILNTDGMSVDTLGTHNLEQLDIDIGLEAKVYADLSIWKVNLAHYPSEENDENGDGKKTIFNPTMSIFSIPTIELADNDVDICSDADFKINATITNPTSLIANPFVGESVEWIVFPSDGATITSTAGNNKEATFKFNKQDEYTVYMMGYSQKLGSVAGKQYKTFAVDTRGCTIDVKFLNSIIKKTGQTKSYAIGGAEVTDGSLKDDGYYQKGVTPSFTRVSDIVTDEITGLMWQDDADSGSITKKWLTDANYDTCINDTTSAACYNTSGDTAVSYCSDLGLGGYSDWRLPTAAELEGIVDYGKYNPSIDTADFNNSSSGTYWSFTTSENHSYNAWSVYFGNGNVYDYYKDGSYYVRCVRDDGQ